MAGWNLAQGDLSSKALAEEGPKPLALIETNLDKPIDKTLWNRLNKS